MSEEYRTAPSKENADKETKDSFPSQQETLQNQKKEIADLKNQIHELRELMEKQKSTSADKDLNNNNSSYQETTRTVTFREIQNARNIYSVPEKNNRTKNQMHHYFSSNTSTDMEKEQRKTYRQPIEVQYEKEGRGKQMKKRSRLAEHPLQNDDDNEEKPEEVKSASPLVTSDNNEDENKASAPPLDTKPVQQTEPESIKAFNPSSPITDKVDTNNKKSVLEYIWGKIKTPI